MALKLANVVKAARTNACIAQFNGKEVRIYSGTQPAAGGAETTLLAKFTLPDPAAPSSTDGDATFDKDNIATVIAAAGGTPTWGRICATDGAWLADFTVSATGGGGDVIVNPSPVVVGKSVAITSMQLADGN